MVGPICYESAQIYNKHWIYIVKQIILHLWALNMKVLIIVNTVSFLSNHRAHLPESYAGVCDSYGFKPEQWMAVLFKTQGY